MDPNPRASRRPLNEREHYCRDRFSDLTKNLILFILSFLPFKGVVRTSAISRQWHSRRRSTRNVQFNERFFHGPTNEKRLAFIRFMRQFIDYCREPVLDSIELVLSRPHEFIWDVYLCMSFVMHCRVKCLGFDFSNPTWAEEERQYVMEGQFMYDAILELPSSFYDLLGLITLRLFSCKFDASKFGNFRALKSLSLSYMELTTSTIDNPFEKCRLLEIFSLRRCWNAEEVYIYEKHLSFETLVMDQCGFLRSWYGIEVPNLRHLKYSGRVGALEVDVGPSIQEVEPDFSLETRV